MTRTNTNTITGPRYGAEANGRDLPWDVMGDALTPAHTTDLTAAMTAAGLDYDVEVWDTKAVDPLTGREVPSPKAAQIVRPTPDGMAVVGSTGRRFTPLQNRDAFAIARDLFPAGAVLSGLADFRHGGASILTMKMPESLTLTTPDGGRDVTDLHLVVKNSHDGQSALSFSLTPMRVACTNALPMAIEGAVRTWKISHTPNAQDRLDLARKAIVEAVGYTEAARAVAQRMMDTPMVDAEFAKIVSRVWNVAPEATGKVADRKRETQAQVVDLFKNSPTMDSIRGTRWAGYNALTEYLDHYRPVKGGTDQAQAIARAEGQIDGPNVRVKARLFDLLSI